MNWEKVGSIHSPKPTFQGPHFESITELGKVSSQFKLHYQKQDELFFTHNMDGHILNLT